MADGSVGVCRVEFGFRGGAGVEQDDERNANSGMHQILAQRLGEYRNGISAGKVIGIEEIRRKVVLVESSA